MYIPDYYYTEIEFIYSPGVFIFILKDTTIFYAKHIIFEIKFIS